MCRSALPAVMSSMVHGPDHRLEVALEEGRECGNTTISVPIGFLGFPANKAGACSHGMTWSFHACPNHLHRQALWAFVSPGHFVVVARAAHFCWMLLCPELDAPRLSVRRACHACSCESLCGAGLDAGACVTVGFGVEWALLCHLHSFLPSQAEAT